MHFLTEYIRGVEFYIIFMPNVLRTVMTSSPLKMTYLYTKVFAYVLNVQVHT